MYVSDLSLLTGRLRLDGMRYSTLKSPESKNQLESVFYKDLVTFPSPRKDFAAFIVFFGWYQAEEDSLVKNPQQHTHLPFSWCVFWEGN